MNTIYNRANAEEYPVTEVTGTVTAEDASVAYLGDKPMGIALESIAVVLILLIVTASTLLGCLLYPFIWLSTRLYSARRSRQAQITDDTGVDGADADSAHRGLEEEEVLRLIERNHY